MFLNRPSLFLIFSVTVWPGIFSPMSVKARTTRIDVVEFSQWVLDTRTQNLYARPLLLAQVEHETGNQQLLDEALQLNQQVIWLYQQRQFADADRAGSSA